MIFPDPSDYKHPDSSMARQLYWFPACPVLAVANFLIIRLRNCVRDRKSWACNAMNPGLLPRTLVVVHELTIQSHPYSRAAGLDFIFVPITDLNLGRCGWCLQIINSACNL